MNLSSTTRPKKGKNKAVPRKADTTPSLPPSLLLPNLPLRHWRLRGSPIPSSVPQHGRSWDDASDRQRQRSASWADSVRDWLYKMRGTEGAGARAWRSARAPVGRQPARPSPSLFQHSSVLALAPWTPGGKTVMGRRPLSTEVAPGGKW